jgi:hypothetical protein
MFMSHKKKKLSTPIIVIIFVLGTFALGGFFLWNVFFGSFSGGYTQQEDEKDSGSSDVITQSDVAKKSSIGISELLNILQTPRTTLVLFLNNTEIRPGGGFIGSYTVLETEGTAMQIHELQGTENLDNNAPASWHVDPPQMITEHLGVNRWYFRDSNWSPDFQQSAKKSLAFYAAEQGVLADEITAVVGVTPTVLEELLRIIGPVVVQGIEFNADSVTETLEYEVEYGYEKRGISFVNRKQIMKPFFEAVRKKATKNILSNSIKYRNLIERMVKEKHILIFVKDGVSDELRGVAKRIGAGGEVYQGTGDSLMWVDANLAALKTDHIMERDLSYTVSPVEGGGFVAVASMEYRHPGTFDWRTSRYKTYARVFVPKGATLIEGWIEERGVKRRIEDVVIEQHEEIGKTSFGNFVVIEPGREKRVSFKYVIAPDVVHHINTEKQYQLVTQKQIGLDGVGLTLHLDFGTYIRDGKKDIPVYTTRELLDYDRKISLSLE